MFKIVGKTFLLLLFCTPLLSHAQKNRPESSGELQLGMRSTLSLFGNHGNTGNGIGGQFRLRVSDRLNTEWFADFIQTDLSGLGQRSDIHIGWSVMFYPLASTLHKPVDPYILAGHCFDYTDITAYRHHGPNESKNRLSSAVQVGLGTHFNITDKTDISLSTQYMLHLGDDIHTGIDSHHGENELHIEENHEHSELGLEGHLLVTLSVNIKLVDLWK